MLIIYNFSVSGLIEDTDVTFVLDTSGSIGETLYEYAKNFIRSIVEAMNIGPQNSRAAVLIFNHGTTIYFSLNQYTRTNKSELITAIRNIPFYGGGTNITIALNFLTTVAQSGSLGINRNKKQVAIFITDGIEEDDTITAAANSFKQTHIFDLYSVGIGYANATQLRLIANDGYSVYYQLPFTKDTLEYYNSQRIIRRLGGLLAIVSYIVLVHAVQHIYS